MPIPAAAGPPGLIAPARALTLGLVTGMRQQLPFALLALAASRGQFDLGSGRLARQLGSAPGVAGALSAAVAELVVDKLPFTPSRTRPGPLLGRVASGSLVGGAVLRDARGSAVLGATLGAVGAAAGAVAGSRFRAAVDRRTSLPDPVWAGVEDLAALGLGLLAVASLPRR
jgi:uncharacterized membrane protein